LRRDGHRCISCGRKGGRGNPLQANHLSYKAYNRTGKTPLRDLEILCRRCHERATGRRFPDGYRGVRVAAKRLVRRRKLLRWVIITAIGLGSYAILR
jgi:5-methylcytosine-specific restriction endonuclease McrA